MAVDEDGLRVQADRVARRGVADVADGAVARPAVERPLVEDVVDEAHALLDAERLPSRGDDARGLLAAVLQGVEPEIGEARASGWPKMPKRPHTSRSYRCRKRSRPIQASCRLVTGRSTTVFACDGEREPVAAHHSKPMAGYAPLLRESLQLHAAREWSRPPATATPKRAASRYLNPRAVRGAPRGRGPRRRSSTRPGPRRARRRSGRGRTGARPRSTPSASSAWRRLSAARSSRGGRPATRPVDRLQVLAAAEVGAVAPSR